MSVAEAYRIIQGGNLSGLPPSLQVLGCSIVIPCENSVDTTIMSPRTCREGGSPLRLPPCKNDPRIWDACVAKIVRNHGLAITTIDVATLISVLPPISEDKGISYLDIAKIEKETQCRLCSSPS
jgi:hypothetical protein